MGLTARGDVPFALSTQEQTPKYTYRFRLEAKKPTAFDDEASKSEVQSYINELLGVKDKSKAETV